MQHSLSRYYIGLGSNLDNPIKQIKEATLELQALHTQCAHEDISKRHQFISSSLYASNPVGPQDQPDFVNSVIGLNSHLSPQDMLITLQTIEQKHLRVRKRHWGERTLDLDILLVDDCVIESNTLIVPHTYMHARAFVLKPLYEIAPKIILKGHSLDYWLQQDHVTAQSIHKLNYNLDKS